MLEDTRTWKMYQYPGKSWWGDQQLLPSSCGWLGWGWWWCVSSLGMISGKGWLARVMKNGKRGVIYRIFRINRCQIISPWHPAAACFTAVSNYSRSAKDTRFKIFTLFSRSQPLSEQFRDPILKSTTHDGTKVRLGGPQPKKWLFTNFSDQT